MSARALKERVEAAFGDPNHWGKYARPMGLLTVRFTGKRLSHVGQAVSQALELSRAELGTIPLTMMGWIPKKGGSTRHATPTSLDGRGGTTLARALTHTKRLPKPEPLRVYLKDSVEMLPVAGACYIGMGSDDSRVDGGTFTVAFDLQRLEEAPHRWVALGDALVKCLDATWGQLGPGLWTAPHSIFSVLRPKDEQLIALWSKDPQLDPPPVLLPLEIDGPTRPAQVLWATKTASKHVDFDGDVTALGRHVRFQLDDELTGEMTAERYLRWARSWESLRPIQSKAVQKYATERLLTDCFRLQPLAALAPTWKQRVTLRHELGLAARLKETRVLEVAEVARNSLEAFEIIEELFPTLAQLLAEQRVGPHHGAVWLDFAETHAADVSAGAKAAIIAVAWHSHDVPRALELIAQTKKDPAGKYVRLHLESMSGLDGLLTDARCARLFKKR